MLSCAARIKGDEFCVWFGLERNDLYGRSSLHHFILGELSVLYLLCISEWSLVSSIKLQGQLKGVVDERSKLVISILLNSGENQVAKVIWAVGCKVHVPADRENGFGVFLGLLIFWKGFETVLGVADKIVIPEASSLVVLTEMYHLRSI